MDLAGHQLELSRRSDLRGAVSRRWLGVAGFELTARGHTLLVDPFLTRPGSLKCLGRLRSDEALLERHLPKADTIVLGHTHYDHALDAPQIAHRTGATVIGSRSAAALCRLAGLPGEQVLVAGGQPVERGPFAVRLVPSAHSPCLSAASPSPETLPERARRCESRSTVLGRCS